MLVRLTIWRATIGGAQAPGHVIDLPQHEAARLVDSGQAELVTNIETTAVTPPRNAMRGRPKHRTKQCANT